MNGSNTKVKPAPWWAAVVVALLVLVVGLALIVSGGNPVTRADASIIEWTAQHRPAWLVDVAKAISLLGHGAILAGIVVAACVGLAWRGILPTRAALLPPIALAIGGGLNPLLKEIVDRPRPPVDLRAAVEHSNGFPSGHASQSASAYMTLGLVLWLWGRGHPRWPLIAAAVLVGAIGITRVILGVHSPTDVLAGWAWGTAVALTVVGAAGYAERRSTTTASPGREDAARSDRPPRSASSR